MVQDVQPIALLNKNDFIVYLSHNVYLFAIRTIINSLNTKQSVATNTVIKKQSTGARNYILRWRRHSITRL